MNKFTIKAAHEVGDMVTDRNSLRSGTIRKVWVKLRESVGEEFTYQADISYTVVPEKSTYNQFRVKEKDIVTYDENGIAF